MDIKIDKHDDHLTVRLAGRLDSSNAGEFEQALLNRIDAGELRLVLDLSELSYISSAGLRVFLMAAKRLSARQGRMALCGLQDNVREVFEISGFTAILTVRADLAEARAALSA
jgi:stage II sporulation protein AA (anti-sigma F factor antagonist)